MNRTICTVTDTDGTVTEIVLRMSLADAIECYCTPAHAVYVDSDGNEYDEQAAEYDEDALTDAAFAHSWAADVDFDSYHGVAY